MAEKYTKQEVFVGIVRVARHRAQVSIEFMVKSFCRFKRISHKATTERNKQ